MDTARLTLAAPTELDRDLYVLLSTDQEVRHYLGGPVDAEASHARFDSLLRSEARVWTVRRQDEGIGMIWLGPHHDPSQTELSYEFLPSAQGHGYATEACEAVISHAFDDLDLPFLVAETQTANARSCSLLCWLGFRKIESFERFNAEQGLWRLDRPCTGQREDARYALSVDDHD